MGRLVDQFCAVCDESFSKSPSWPSLLLFILALLGWSPRIDPQVRLDPNLATVAHVRIMLERLVQGSKMPELFLVVGLIRAIEDVLEDCSQETPKEGKLADWSPATERLTRFGVLIDADGGLAVMGGTEKPVPDRRRQARADLEMWREVTARILEEQNLEQAIRKEVEDG